MKKIFLCLFMLVNIELVMNSQSLVNHNINCDKALDLIQKHSSDTNFIILDVRTPEEYNSGHIEKAIMIDYNSPGFKEEISRLDKNKSYLVYCRKGGRSSETMKIMKEQGFLKLYHLFEGFATWEENGYKTVK